MNHFSETILSWYKTNKRDLPWRSTTDPYRILVSELMLQQTQVNRVLPLYENFIKTWPTLDDLSKASLGDVLRAWKGLGYNRRAKFLWELAKHENNKLLYRKLSKEEVSTLQQLPGIGHYTAAAIAAFAHNTDVIAQDTNIRRIYHRYFRNTEPSFIQHTVPEGHARDFNNALMDFGSLICTKQPRCLQCPLRNDCKAFAEQEFTVIVPKQPTFKDSNRYYRGKILDALRTGKKTKEELLALGAKEKIEKALASLLRERLVQQNNNAYFI